MPSDGGLQLCPACLAKKKINMSKLATKAKAYQACCNIAVGVTAEHYVERAVCSRAIAHAVNGVAIAIHHLALEDGIVLQDAPSDAQAGSGPTNAAEQGSQL